MNEKRFIRNIGGQVYDTENDKFLDEDYVGKPIGYEDGVVECLNTLHEENEQLKQQIKDMKIRFKRKYDHEFDEIVDELW